MSSASAPTAAIRPVTAPPAVSRCTMLRSLAISRSTDPSHLAELAESSASRGPSEAGRDRQRSLIGTRGIPGDRPRLYLLMVRELALEVLEDPLESQGATVGAGPRDGLGQHFPSPALRSPRAPVLPLRNRSQTTTLPLQ